MEKIPFLEFFNNSNYQIYNRSLAKLFKKIEAAIMFSELVDRYIYHVKQDKLTEKDGKQYFYYTLKLCEDRTALSPEVQASSIKILKKFNLIETRVFGLPSKRYFCLNLAEIKHLAEFEADFKEIYTSNRKSGKVETVKTASSSPLPLYIKEPELKNLIDEDQSVLKSTKNINNYKTNFETLIAFAPTMPLCDANAICRRYTSDVMERAFQKLNRTPNVRNPLAYLHTILAELQPEDVDAL